MHPQLTKLRGAALDLLFPRICVSCGKQGNFLCDSCRGSLAPVGSPACPLCGGLSPDGGRCSSCEGWRADIDGIMAPYRFEGPLRDAIHQMKYNNLRAIADDLAELLKVYALEKGTVADVIVPVPLHPRRLRERGYNQSALLARALGGKLGVPVDESGLIRDRYALPQARTRSIEERRRNVLGVFGCRDTRFESKRVIVVDDVTTSGATMNACAAALKSKGAAEVRGMALAKEI